MLINAENCSLLICPACPNFDITATPDSESRLVLYHQGSLPGYTSSVHLLPETQTGIVVLTNSLGISDCADWVGQLLIETLLDSKEKNDYVDPARRSAARHLSLFDEVEKDLAEENQDGTSPRPISEYVGKYWNLAGNWFIEILTLPASAGECDSEKKLLFIRAS